MAGAGAGAVAACGCSGDDSPGAADSGAPMDAARVMLDSSTPVGTDAAISTPVDAAIAFDAADCKETLGAAATFVEANKTCSIDADCVQVAAPCYSMNEDCCTTYMRASYDRSAWNAIYAAVMACDVGGCGCCASIPAPAGCIEGRCRPRRIVVGG